MQKLTLAKREIDQIAGLLAEVKQRFTNTESQEFLDEVGLYAHQLPYRVRQFMHRYKLGHFSEGLCCLSGFVIDDAKLGDTPRHWLDGSDAVSSLEERILHFMCASLLGEVFGWSTQQKGRIIHDVFPIKDYEFAQLGFSSKEPLTWHTEDAFHDYRPDYLALMCLRNRDGVGTHCCKPDYSALTDEQRSYLFGKHYTIKPDNSHLSVNNFLSDTQAAEREASFRDIEQMASAPQKVSVLFGHPDDPYLRIDPYFMERAEDPKAQDALDAFIRLIEASYREYPLEQGDIFFINNLRVVHGRRSFVARYDGKDRWLKRLLISRDLGKSRDRRAHDYSRIIA
ncbi:MAG TPA: guanitoxin biosynthesis L-enduracididine beta-hydroxylase GntD [Kofleriaceae bacterium]